MQATAHPAKRPDLVQETNLRFVSASHKYIVCVRELASCPFPTLTDFSCGAPARVRHRALGHLLRKHSRQSKNLGNVDSLILMRISIHPYIHLDTSSSSRYNLLTNCYVQDLSLIDMGLCRRIPRDLVCFTIRVQAIANHRPISKNYSQKRTMHTGNRPRLRFPGPVDGPNWKACIHRPAGTVLSM